MSLLDFRRSVYGFDKLRNLKQGYEMVFHYAIVRWYISKVYFFAYWYWYICTSFSCARNTLSSCPSSFTSSFASSGSSAIESIILFVPWGSVRCSERRAEKKIDGKRLLRFDVAQVHAAGMYKLDSDSDATGGSDKRDQGIYDTGSFDFTSYHHSNGHSIWRIDTLS